MRGSWPCLLLIAASMTIVGCSSPGRTALVTPPAPLACLVPCPEYPSPPPQTDALDAWLQWGDDLAAEYGWCAVLHNDCVIESSRNP